jgi:agmatinase
LIRTGAGSGLRRVPFGTALRGVIAAGHAGQDRIGTVPHHQPRASFQSPRFAQPATFMRLPHVTDFAGLDVAIIGVPFDGGTSYRSGTRLGPREIRSQSSLIRTYSYFQKIAPFDVLNVADVGDVDVPPVGIEKAFDAIELEVGRILDAGAIPIAVGGDHSISLPLLRAVASRRGPLNLVQFDAHIDTWDDYFGGKYFHGSPFRRAIDEKLIDPQRFVQVGIRGPMYGEEDFEFHREHRITIVDIEQVKTPGGVERTIDEMRRILTGPTYVTFDIDSIDPAFAPGTGTPEVGGLTSHEAQRLLRGLAGLDIAGCDIVEVAPAFDGPGQITALLAANLMFEMLCAIAGHRTR